MSRISRDDFYMSIADLASKRSTCNRLQVGCVLIDADSNRVASIGYNSSFKHTPHCEDSDCLLHNGHCIRTLHAEQAAVVNLVRRYDSLICYTTHKPCINCFKLLAAINVKKIYYTIDYKDEGRDLLNKEIGLEMIHVTDDLFC